MSEYACVCMFIIMMPPNHFQEKKSIYLYLPVKEFVYLIYMYASPFISLSINLSVCLSVNLSI